MSISAQPYEPIGSTALSEQFFVAHGIGGENAIQIDTQSESIEEQSNSNISEKQSSAEYAPGSHNAYAGKLSLIQDLINSYDFVGAAEEILKLNIGDIPQNMFSQYTNMLEITAENLSSKDTYLNAQLASQSLVVMSIQDELHENGILHALDDATNGQTMESLGLNSLSFSSFDNGASNAVPVIFFSGGAEEMGADEFNPQKNPDTAVLARFMKQQTEGDHRAASLDHGGTYGQHAYTLELKIPGQF